MRIFLLVVVVLGVAASAIFLEAPLPPWASKAIGAVFSVWLVVLGVLIVVSKYALYARLFRRRKD
ncbi:MAG: hypothetical protein E6Q97_27520 [Desulfurellales bacterium]|nr:MAG: hypothetical protein E6Q97_27520 [Desulfurellales bacterium]